MAATSRIATIFENALPEFICDYEFWIHRWKFLINMLALRGNSKFNFCLLLGAWSHMHVEPYFALGTK